MLKLYAKIYLVSKFPLFDRSGGEHFRECLRRWCILGRIIPGSRAGLSSPHADTGSESDVIFDAVACSNSICDAIIDTGSNAAADRDPGANADTNAETDSDADSASNSTPDANAYTFAGERRRARPGLHVLEYLGARYRGARKLGSRVGYVCGNRAIVVRQRIS